MSAARKRSLFVAAIAFIVGVVMLVLSSYFLQLHCVMAFAVALAGGIAAARAAMPYEPAWYRGAGSTGGLYAAIGYALPFIGFNLYNWLTITPALASQRMAQLSPEQIALAQQNSIQLGVEYFKGQDIAYVFGYLMFALLIGTLVGLIGGVLAKRQLA